jgi:Glycosyltransferase WbsX
MQSKASTLSLAAYLPQFHEIKENNDWWGEGFTEWVKLTDWHPWKKGHQIRRPTSQFGYYNLLAPGVMEKQYDTALSHGIDGFAVWDYWFGAGQRLLEKPLENVLKDRLHFKYCIAWANHTWLNRKTNQILREQRYLGASDYLAYFNLCSRHFETDNYIKIENKPVFFIYNPNLIPDLPVFIETWQRAAERCGFSGIYFIGDQMTYLSPGADFFDKIGNGFAFWTTQKKLFLNFIKEKARTKLDISWRPQFYDYWQMLHDAMPLNGGAKYMPTAIAGWDTTPRHADRGVVFENFNPDTFAKHLESIFHFFENTPTDHAVILLKSWNEWAEGNCIEPDNIFGTNLLECYRNFSYKLRDHRMLLK